MDTRRGFVKEVRVTSDGGRNQRVRDRLAQRLTQREVDSQAPTPEKLAAICEAELAKLIVHTSPFFQVYAKPGDYETDAQPKEGVGKLSEQPIRWATIIRRIDDALNECYSIYTIDPDTHRSRNTRALKNKSAIDCVARSTQLFTRLRQKVDLLPAGWVIKDPASLGITPVGGGSPSGRRQQNVQRSGGGPSSRGAQP